jgi:hypothetical protein
MVSAEGIESGHHSEGLPSLWSAISRHRIHHPEGPPSLRSTIQRVHQLATSVGILQMQIHAAVGWPYSGYAAGGAKLTLVIATFTFTIQNKTCNNGCPVSS